MLLYYNFKIMMKIMNTLIILIAISFVSATSSPAEEVNKDVSHCLFNITIDPLRVRSVYAE
jgi:hypothetical protein